MCRMIGVLSRKPVEAAPYVDALVEQAVHGTKAPHADGYGVAVLAGNHWLHLREQCPIQDGALDAVRLLRGNILILHVRKASDTGTINLAKTHPFFQRTVSGPGVMFCQNGTVRRHELLKTRCGSEAIDTEKYFDLIMSGIERNVGMEEAVAQAVQTIEEANADPISVNCLLSDGRTLLAYKGRILPEYSDYHLLHVLEKDGISIVSTEPFGAGEWRLLDGFWQQSL